MKWVVIDEVQKIPVLLNVIHALIEETDIVRDVGVDDKSVIQYFSILEDTLLGFYLPAFQFSFRKCLSHKPKFYFIDIYWHCSRFIAYIGNTSDITYL